MPASPQMYVICILTPILLTLPSTQCLSLPSCVHSASSHSTPLILSCSLNEALSVSSLPPSCSALCMLRIPTKRFGREGITLVPFSGDFDFKFVPEVGHPDRSFSPEVNVVIYFKSHHSRLVLHCSHILVEPVHYSVIHKSLPEFRTRLRNNQDRHGRKERINR